MSLPNNSHGRATHLLTDLDIRAKHCCAKPHPHPFRFSINKTNMRKPKTFDEVQHKPSNLLTREILPSHSLRRQPIRLDRDSSNNFRLRLANLARKMQISRAWVQRRSAGNKLGNRGNISMCCHFWETREAFRLLYPSTKEIAFSKEERDLYWKTIDFHYGK